MTIKNRIQARVPSVDQTNAATRMVAIKPGDHDLVAWSSRNKCCTKVVKAPYDPVLTHGRSF